MSKFVVINAKSYYDRFLKIPNKYEFKKIFASGAVWVKLMGEKTGYFIKCPIKYYQNKSFICAISIMQNNENIKERTKLAKTH